ncbi:hypothetical protein CCR97_27650 [Rhodoplanes elegans]|uniref:Uncharacterized protein n=1 Tax=Rhodoplanes elegans TaxID=29408 RepID=A0A327KHU0_9BRAD|nr:hypothetical protein [Rhodoplanes elegans]MBK5961951.1 hypothetical protein [Rhodoplanes elegans]RAI34838.1 hypothetical protein CH338_20275 [Rhodoplanes elegans]
MFRVLLRSLKSPAGSSDPVAGRCKTAPLFIPSYRSSGAIRVNARPPRPTLARRKLGRLIEARRRAS